VDPMRRADVMHSGVHPHACVAPHRCPSVPYRRVIDHSTLTDPAVVAVADKYPDRLGLAPLPRSFQGQVGVHAVEPLVAQRAGERFDVQFSRVKPPNEQRKDVRDTRRRDHGFSVRPGKGGILIPNSIVPTGRKDALGSAPLHLQDQALRWQAS
jgi:hypothetical protein